MKPSSTLLLAGACAAGLLTGIVGKRLVRTAAPSSEEERLEESAGQDGGPSASGVVEANPASADRKSGKKDPAVTRSTDTVESLIAITDGTLYQRLSLWLMDASEEDIAVYWQAYQNVDRSKRSRDINDLVFLNWARLNPQGAIAGAGPGNEPYAWWAWASHDPKASLAAAIGVGGDRLKDVAFGIGEFHPDWLREHFKELPEEARQKALAGLAKWDDGQEPLATLRFMKEHGLEGGDGTIKALARKDPEEAIAWAKSYRGEMAGVLEFVAKTLAAERPDDLRRLIESAPSGEARRKMEAALFGNLVKTDPAAALEQARVTTIPRLAAERYAALGLDAVKGDPEKAFGLAKDLFTKCPDALNLNSAMELPDETSLINVNVPGMREFAERLLVKDPARTLEMALGLPVKDPRGILRNFSNQWATKDLAAYTAWASQQADPRIRDVAAGIVSDRLTARGHFEEAAEWAASGADAGRNLESVMSRWKDADPAAASRWLDSASVPDSTKDAAGKYLDPDE